MLTADGELRLGNEYVARVEAAPPALRPQAPLVKTVVVEALTGFRTETTSYQSNGQEVEHKRTVIETEVNSDQVLFETPKPNLRAIAKRTAPNRTVGWAQVAVGVLLAGTAGYIATKGHSELPEKNRGTAYQVAAGTAFISLPFVAVGSYMVLAPETSELLWSSPVR